MKVVETSWWRQWRRIFIITKGGGSNNILRMILNPNPSSDHRCVDVNMIISGLVDWERGKKGEEDQERGRKGRGIGREGERGERIRERSRWRRVARLLNF